MLDKKYVSDRLEALTEVFNVKWGLMTVALFYDAIKHLEKHEFDLAVRRTMDECKFMPRPAEFLAFARASTVERVVVAFQELKTALAGVGAYRSVDFEDKAINATVRGMGGWLRLCHLPSEELEVWGRKEFDRQYPVFARNPPGEEMHAHLSGLIEGDHVRLGKEAPPPIAIAATSPLMVPARARPALPPPASKPTKLIADVAKSLSPDFDDGVST